MHYFVAFIVCNHVDEEERAGCFASLSFGCLVTVNVLWLFLTVSWVGLQCVMWYFLILLSELSGRVLDSRLRGCEFEPHWRHRVVSLSKTH